jgi:hypothetical protein
MNKATLQKLAIGTVLIITVSLVVMEPPVDQGEVENQSCWTNEDPLMATLPRYNDAYHSLTDKNEKEDLARLYLLAISKDALVLPSKEDVKKVQVILPVTNNENIIMVLREIQLGSDNGLHGAFLQRKYKPRLYEPPGYPSKIEKLVDRIISGCGEA